MFKTTVVRTQLGTPIQIDVVSSDEGEAQSAIAAAFDECARIEQAYSRFIDNNELATLNANVGAWTELSEEFYKLIEFGERVKQRTGGAFDLSVKSILEGWGYDQRYSLQEGAPGKVGQLELDGSCVKLHAPIELGGLGKGYAIDRMDSVLSAFDNVHINAGGDIRVRGRDEDGAPWRLVFEHPQDKTKAIGYVDTTNLALACSSPSRRSWRNRHHLVDPRTGEPAEGLLAVYTQSSSALLADTYSTALFVLGYEAAQKLVAELAIEAMLIAKDGTVFRSSGFEGTLFTE